MPKEFMYSDAGKSCKLDSVPLQEVEGLLFACLENDEQCKEDMTNVQKLINPYIHHYHLGKDEYKLAYHERVEIDANWLV
ncbi:hypothetical protein NQX30_04885 [Candidatus Persebacteraceae bacterium Df01]|jgi:phenylpropionate dioxygenase-like ring-hydroxylating dioxygenase large terminal subunit|uniref:Uncharacterized protein n=1 Tax=Candidatus Doriopsillibacter californiensis TaxID=2970740 RepID=A0ABT7QMS1_9GAMM|nr:hypothetical protein [Candidatus Persebacteraceae bacterium Df01]